MTYSDDVIQVKIIGGRDGDSLFKKFRCDRFESEIETVESLIKSFGSIQRVRLETRRGVEVDVSITMPSTICSTSLAEAQLSPLQIAANNHCKDIQVGTSIKLRYALNKEFRRGNTLLEVTVDGVADLVCSVEGISQFLENYDELNQYADELEFTYLSEDL